MNKIIKSPVHIPFNHHLSELPHFARIAIQILFLLCILACEDKEPQEKSYNPQAIFLDFNDDLISVNQDKERNLYLVQFSEINEYYSLDMTLPIGHNTHHSILYGDEEKIYYGVNPPHEGEH